MNQEQNNFNIQGNNGIPNNQPLQNNPNLNNSFSQGMQQNTSASQSTFNSPPELISNYQQPVNQMNVQQTTTQLNTSFQTGNVNNQNSNIKQPKKNNLKFIILIISVIVMIGLGVGTFLLFNSSPDNNDNTTDDVMDKNNVKITGSSQLVKEYKKNGYDVRLARGFESGPYFIYADESVGTLDVLDMNGNILFTIDDDEIAGLSGMTYLKDGYFEISGYGGDTFKIIDNRGNTSIFDTEHGLTFYYDNGVLYYSYGSKTRAYNLKTKKQIWEIDGVNPFILENSKLVLQKSKFSEEKKIADKDSGVILVESNNSDIKLYVTESCYYLVSNAFIDVYDYENNKLSSYNLINDDNYKDILVTVLSNGGYVIENYDKKNYSSLYKYKVFNKNGEEILAFDGKNVKTDSLFSGRAAKRTSTSGYSLLTDNQSSYRALTYIIYADDTIAKVYGAKKIDDYIIGYINDDFDNDTIKIINLKTKEEKVLTEPLLNNFTTSNNNSYFIVSASYDDKVNKYYVYDNSFKNIYSTKNNLRVVNDEYFLEIESFSQSKSNIYLINAKTLKKTLLETNGVYDFNTENNLVTYEFNGNKQWLYKFK